MPGGLRSPEDVMGRKDGGALQVWAPSKLCRKVPAEKGLAENDNPSGRRQACCLSLSMISSFSSGSSRHVPPGSDPSVLSVPLTISVESSYIRAPAPESSAPGGKSSSSCRDGISLNIALRLYPGVRCTRLSVSVSSRRLKRDSVSTSLKSWMQLASRSTTANSSRTIRADKSFNSLKDRYSSCSRGIDPIPSSSTSPHRQSHRTCTRLKEVPRSRISGILDPLNFRSTMNGRCSPTEAIRVDEASSSTSKQVTSVRSLTPQWSRRNSGETPVSSGGGATAVPKPSRGGTPVLGLPPDDDGRPDGVLAREPSRDPEALRSPIPTEGGSTS
mmetsp:Transcript_82810/g.221250  ORF Transcript_82810/g.221250 Transcript_82810/m.221250 type:complete len:330 (-) Transcript_82810:21-1010(-)